jgi:hypothetical protein
MEWDYVSELRPSTCVLFIPQLIYECGERWWNDINRGKPKNTGKTCPNAEPRFERSTSRTRCRSVSHSTTTFGRKYRTLYRICRTMGNMKVHKNTGRAKKCLHTLDTHSSHINRDRIMEYSAVMYYSDARWQCVSLYWCIPLDGSMQCKRKRRYRN